MISFKHILSGDSNWSLKIFLCFQISYHIKQESRFTIYLFEKPYTYLDTPIYT